MEQSDVQFIDASEWNSLPWLSTGGTRSKRVLQSPDGKEWYFKCSEKKPAKDGRPAKEYKYEFWNEIIVYQIGTFLGLEVLRYDVALHENEIGCISPLMIQPDESLIEVGRYMTAINPHFLPEDNATRKEYTFQLLEKTLKEFGLIKYWEFFFETILFDAIIDNTDRHQENWAFISSSKKSEGQKIIEEALKSSRDEELNNFSKIISHPLKELQASNIDSIFKQAQLAFQNIVSTAPIYDSGSSLARELSDEKVDLLLNDKVALTKYIEKGATEIHWEKKKISHFQLVENLLNSSHAAQIKDAAVFLNNWDEDAVVKIISAIDNSLPDNWHNFRIPKPRKALMIKLLSLRTQKLKQLIHAGI